MLVATNRRIFSAARAVVRIVRRLGAPLRLLEFTTAIFFLLAAAPRGASAAEPPADAPRYETDVAPILQANCSRCHSTRAMKAELDLSTPHGIFKGGESGPAVASGNLEESLLYEMISSELMPPEEDRRLAQRDVETIRRWIEAGAPFVGPIDIRQLAAAAEVNNHDIEPLMRLRCTVCHGLRTKEAGLDLRTKASMLAGGKSGPAIVLGNPQQSLLMIRLHAGEMPPRKRLISASVKPMTGDEIQRLARWIELAAPEVVIQADVAVTDPDPLVSDEDRQFWSFQPPRQVRPPNVKYRRQVRNPIDAFVLRKLEEKGLTLSDEADRLTLMRRAYFDLTGLPPEPHEVQAYLSDGDPQAYEKLIDRLLDSPRYGERWGRFWLDAAGYADSEGKRSADPLRPYAYKYRDYVIRSFNADKPYDQFLIEQIAGDELVDYDNAAEITQQMADNLIATGFLRMAPDGTGSDVVNHVPERLEVISDEIDIFSSTVLGLTIKCARCHSHKYDPIPQRDYYRLADIFKGAYDEHDWLKPAFVSGQTKVTRPGRVLPYATTQQLRDNERRNAEIDAEIQSLQDKIAALADAVRNQHLEEQLAAIPDELRSDLRRMLATSADRRDQVQQYLAEKFEKTLWLDDSALKQHQGYRRAAVELERQIKSLEGEKNDGPQIRALWDRGEPSPTYIYRRGDYLQPGRLVGPGVPSVLTDGRTPLAVQPPWPGAKKTGRRLALARWLVEPDHPLTSRVMVNRIWKHHFGEGIVRSLGNFGRLGDPPSHPDLLDWLARRFVADGWSMKKMHRLMMTSAVYRQSSQVSPLQLQADGDNGLLSRMPLRRMSAEQLRDSLLLVAGRLDESRFGRPDSVNVRGDGLVTSVGTDQGWRRSIYVRQRRKSMPTILETFDLPQMNPACQQRFESNVAQQALHLMNDSMIRQLSRHFAQRVGRETADPLGRVERVFMIALSRPPTPRERQASTTALLELADRWTEQLQHDGQPTQQAEQEALATFCHTMMNSAAFLYID